MVEELSDVERWQKSEDDRLEYEGHCNKIRQGLEDVNEKSGERALWELIQNARDMSENARIKIELCNNSIIFSHHGKPFDYTTFIALVKQDSSKDRNGADLVGQYGTGFMTTHQFNRLVYVSGPYVVKVRDSIKGYIQIKDFKLDRTLVETIDGPKKMREQVDEVKNFYKGVLKPGIVDDTTSFRYNLTDSQIDNVSIQLSNAIRLMPFVLTLNARIKEIEIFNQYAKEHITLRKSNNENRVPLDRDGWYLVTEDIIRTDNTLNVTTETITCCSLQSDKGDVVIIPPYASSCGLISEIPSLFLWFPLLGTEAFGVNFIFHSKRFYPVEKRNNIMLPGSSSMKREKGGKNSAVLKEMTEVLFEFFAKDENAKRLTRQMCEVSFPQLCDDEETLAFYKELQTLWNTQLPNWKIIPISGDYYSVSDARVKLLHRDFYSQLNEEQRQVYESILTSYACLPQNNNGQSYLIPNEDLIAWSETVDKWDCKRDGEFFITVADVCKTIQAKGDDLHSFLKLMKDSGNEKVVEEYALLPNRDGELRKRGELCHASFMTDDVYNVVKDVMGSDSKKILDTTFCDICEVSSYTKMELQRAITSTMSSWRSASLNSSNKQLLKDNQLVALIDFCSASHLPEFNNARGRMMPLLASFHNKEYRKIPIISFRDDAEEEFYASAYNLLLDYTLYLLSQKDAAWVSENKTWLKSFLSEYSPSTNEERKKKLDDYGVLPNQKGFLCLMKNLRRNGGVPCEMTDIYKKVLDVDLYETWVDTEFEGLITFAVDEPKDIAKKIEGPLVEDMKQDSSDRKYEKIVRSIVLKIAESKEWEEWFGYINDKKAEYTFSMKSGNAQKSLFSLMDMNDDYLDRLAKLAESNGIENLLDRLEHQQELERNEAVRFHNLHIIGKYIENVLLERIGRDMVAVEGLNDVLTSIEDVQNGQDIVVRVKHQDEWKDIYYVEVKSKWDFSEPAHMSMSQINKAVHNPDKYALCCVDLRPYKNGDLLALSEDTIINCTRVKMEIGNDLAKLMQEIVRADDNSDDVQIKISDYRSNMSARVFEVGQPIIALLNKIEKIIKETVAL